MIRLEKLSNASRYIANNDVSLSACLDTIYSGDMHYNQDSKILFL